MEQLREPSVLFVGVADYALSSTEQSLYHVSENILSTRQKTELE